MKGFTSTLVLALLVITPPAYSVPKKIIVQPLQLLTAVGIPAEVSGLVVSGKNLIIFGTQNSQAYARALDTTGNELWKLALDTSIASIATAATVDSVGDIWITGATPVTTGATAPINPIVPINPDNAVTPLNIFVGDLDVITLWKVSASGGLIFSSTFPTSYGVLPTAIAVNQAGASIVGVMASEKVSAGFLINCDLVGTFSKLLQIGSVSTTAESIIRHNNGSFTVAGSSAEIIAGKKLVGVVDGFLVKVSSTLKITTVVRSSIIKGKRIWSSASSSLLLAGEIVAGAKSEVAVTKFSSTYVPTWTYRFTGVGAPHTVGSTQLLFLSTSTIGQLLWNPKRPTPLLISFDTKGRIIAADSAPSGQSAVIGAVNSNELGFLVITSSPDTVSVYTRKPR